ncbi:MAG: glycosyltransferase family 39 protein [Acidobacteriia bacterium]|nr:glycosyltransferase family 39 protein [Terriglobia bacterium]
MNVSVFASKVRACVRDVRAKEAVHLKGLIDRPGVWLGLLPTAVFFIVGLIISSDYGVTIDEPESVEGSKAYLKIVLSFFSGQSLPAWPFHELRGYYFPTDLIRGITAAVVSKALPSINYYRGFHLANLIFSSASLFLIYEIVVLVCSKRRVALMSAFSLALMPQFIAHSQNNPKDLIALFGVALAVWCVLKFCKSDSNNRVLIGLAGLGWALTTTPFAFLAVVLMTVWLAIFRPTRFLWRWKNYFFLIAGGIFVAILFWPWLWDDPISKIYSVLLLPFKFSFNIHEVYMRKIYLVSDLPWHYVPAHLFSSVPLPMLMGLFLSVGSLLLKKENEPQLRPLLSLAGMWLMAGLAISFQSSLKYNAMRHFLFLLPALSVLVGAGFEILMTSWGKKVGISLVVTFYSFCLIQMIRIHPYEGAFLNGIANSAIREPSDEVFSLEYFGHAYQEGARWLNAHAENGAKIFVPMAASCANMSLEKKTSPGSLEKFEDSSQPSYLMYITRRSRYEDMIRYAESNLKPVFEIRRQKAVLLKIFKNTTGMVR